jgi:hypothetical protein
LQALLGKGIGEFDQLQVPLGQNGPSLLVTAIFGG